MAGPENHCRYRPLTAKRQGLGLGKEWDMMKGGRDERISPAVKSATGEAGRCLEFL